MLLNHNKSVFDMFQTVFEIIKCQSEAEQLNEVFSEKSNNAMY